MPPTASHSLSSPAAFEVEGKRCSLSELLAANADDPDVCDWARTAKPGDHYPAFVSCKAINAESSRPHPARGDPFRLSFQHPQGMWLHLCQGRANGYRVLSGVCLTTGQRLA